MTLEDVYEFAIEKYGEEAQRLVAIEEMSELTKELCKCDRGMGDLDHICEEIADVVITLSQVIIMFDCYDEVEDWIYYKTQRLAERIFNE